jgi:hypothetical protein
MRETFLTAGASFTEAPPNLKTFITGKNLRENNDLGAIYVFTK